MRNAITERNNRMKIQNASLSDDLLAAIPAKDPVSGYTHNFYRYPARFSPLFVREVIRHYSQPGDTVFDPFMGGGTTIVEALALGRRSVGVDLNTLGHFVATVKTTPLSENDVSLLDDWADDVCTSFRREIGTVSERIRNFPRHVRETFGNLLPHANWLPMKRQRQFVRCALLRTGQWATDCKKRIPSSREIVEAFISNMDEMKDRMQAFTASCQHHGLHKTRIRRNRLLLCRSTIGLEDEDRLRLWPKPKLVITSPPYPSVHILYHRWQVNGRKETPAPYWLAALKDGHTASHYTFGSRSLLGLENYFRNVEECFRSVRQIVAPNAVVVQLVAFSNAESQLPRYVAAMERAGFVEFHALAITGDNRVWRRVPNRKWYCHNGKEQDSAKEVVLFYRPA